MTPDGLRRAMNEAPTEAMPREERRPERSQDPPPFQRSGGGYSSQARNSRRSGGGSFSDTIITAISAFATVLIGTILAGTLWWVGAMFTIIGITHALEETSLINLWNSFGWAQWILPISVSVVEFVANPKSKYLPKKFADHIYAVWVVCIVTILIDGITTFIGLGASDLPWYAMLIKDNILVCLVVTAILTFGPEYIMIEVTKLFWNSLTGVWSYAEDLQANLQNKMKR